MTNYFSYKIIPEEKLIVGYVKGQIIWKDVIDFKKKLTFDPNYSPEFNIIDDIRDVEIVLNDQNDILEFFDFARTHKIFLGPRKSAVITNSPNQVVNSEMLISINKEIELPINFKTFSTVEAAITWLGISPDNSEFIKSILDDLKKGDQSN